MTTNKTNTTAFFYPVAKQRDLVLRQEYVRMFVSAPVVPMPWRVAEFARIFAVSALPVMYVCWVLTPFGGGEGDEGDQKKLLTAPLCVWVYLSWLFRDIERACAAPKPAAEVSDVLDAFGIAAVIALSGALAISRASVAWTTVLGVSSVPLAMNAGACVRRRIADEIKEQHTVSVDTLRTFGWYLNGIVKRAREEESGRDRRRHSTTTASSDEAE